MSICKHCKTVKKNHQLSIYTVNIQDIWNSVDKSLCLFPNALREHDMIESCFFLPQKRKLIDNKDKDVGEQASHIQAKTIQTKLASLIHFLKFLEDRRIYAGFTRAELRGTKQFLGKLKVGLRNLITERETKIRENKSKIFLAQEVFKNYGSPKYS